MINTELPLSRRLRLILPKKSKITPGERRKWLEISEQGESIIKIANESERDVRSIKVHIEKARLERSFELAQRNQLENALQSHQQDLLGLLKDLKESINVPELDYFEPVGLDFGIEDLWSPSDLARNRDNLLPHRPVVTDRNNGPQTAPVYLVIRDMNGPQEIQSIPETSRLWRALKEHIRQDRLWRNEGAWRKALLDELQRRADLNRAIREKAEEIFGLSVGLRGGSQEPWLAPAVISWIRTRLTNNALGNYVRPIEEELTETSPGSLRTMDSRELTASVEDPMAHIQQTLSAMEDNSGIDAAAKSYEYLRESTRSVHDAIDEHLLIHYITGLCGLCQKLGGQ